MPSEPLEAELAYPPILTPKQEDEYRELEQENSERNLPVHDLERAITKENPFIVTFEPGKGEDPREWSQGRKWYVTLTAAFLCLAVAIGSSIVTGDLQSPVPDLNTTQEIVNLSVTCFVIGFGIGPLFFAPPSEVVGRTPMYIASIFFYFIFTLPSALAKNSATLIVARQIAGLAASAPMCNVGGTVADVWSIEERGVPMAVFSFTIFMGPCVGPLVGAWIAMRAGWRWLYWVLFIFAGCCFVLTLFIPESLAPVLLRRKAAKLRKETGDDRYMSLQEMERKPLSQVLKTALLRPLIMLFTESIVIFMSFYLSFVYSLLYLMFFAFPIAFAEIRGFSPGMTGVTFISIMLGIGFAMACIPFQERLYRKKTQYGSYPEARLYPMMFGSLVLPISLFIFAFTGAYEWVHWIAVCISGTLFGFSMILIYISANSYIVDSYSAFAASAIAAKTLLRSEIASSVPLFVNQMFHHMGFQYAGLLLALVACVITPIPFFFFKYGERIRRGSSKASQSIKRTAENALTDEKVMDIAH